MSFTHVLIVNLDGQLSAMPTVQEYHKNHYSIKNMHRGLVRVSPELEALVFENRDVIRVLGPKLPPVLNVPGWIYVAVVDSTLTCIGQQIPSINIQKRVETTSFLTRYFYQISDFFKSKN
ncbi:hypothetical protein [Dyadobacter frigoris]|uniref:Uncharacterized protein n=1 Tax=Dyadobacter frigoris TaxID=2576211 RepID=A0A4V6BJM5_9BACT|nr:hypothetical protein [Dyadobacter frigoris]TKT89463.1 hypothetical protein FDK13_24280 [Dyadobacter frigoris]